MERWLTPCIIVTENLRFSLDRMSLQILNLNLRFSFEMKWWLTPHCCQPESHWRCNILWMMIDPTHIVVDQKLTENFKFRIEVGQGKMIDPQYHWPITHYKF